MPHPRNMQIHTPTHWSSPEGFLLNPRHKEPMSNRIGTGLWSSSVFLSDIGRSTARSYHRWEYAVKLDVLIPQDPGQCVMPEDSQEEKAPLGEVPVPGVGHQVQVRQDRCREGRRYEAGEHHGWAFARARWCRRSALRERISWTISPIFSGVVIALAYKESLIWRLRIVARIKS